MLDPERGEKQREKEGEEKERERERERVSLFQSTTSN